MKLYLVIYQSYLETEGLDTTVEIFKTREEALLDLARVYNDLMFEMLVDSEFEWNEFDADRYSIGSYNKHSEYERYEAHIEEKEV